MCGYLPAPAVYGVISSFMQDRESRVPMAVILYSTLLTIFLALFGLNKRIRTVDLDNHNEQMASLMATKDKGDSEDSSVIEGDLSHILGGEEENKRADDDHAGPAGRKSNTIS